MDFETLSEYKERIHFCRACRQLCAILYIIGFLISTALHYWNGWLTTSQYLLSAVIATVLMLIKMVAAVEFQDELIDALIEEEVS